MNQVKPKNRQMMYGTNAFQILVMQILEIALLYIWVDFAMIMRILVVYGQKAFIKESELPQQVYCFSLSYLFLELNSEEQISKAIMRKCCQTQIHFFLCKSRCF
jgi:hypothetical protein